MVAAAAVGSEVAVLAAAETSMAVAASSGWAAVVAVETEMAARATEEVEVVVMVVLDSVRLDGAVAAEAPLAGVPSVPARQAALVPPVVPIRWQVRPPSATRQLQCRRCRQLQCNRRS